MKAKKRKREDSDSSVVESSEESTKGRRQSKKYCILHGKCLHFTANFKDLFAMLNMHKSKKKKSFRNYRKSNKELNALIEKKIQMIVKLRNGGRQKKKSSTFNKCRYPTMKVKRVFPAW